MSRRLRATAAVVAAMCWTVAGCGSEPPAPETGPRPVKMLTIGGELGGLREYPGRIRAAQQVDMAFEVPGRIIEFVYREGDRVPEGAVLARLDPRDYENSLEQAMAILRQAQTYRDRIAKAHKTRAVSDQDMTNAEAQVEVAAAEVKIRQKALDDTRLVAPFAGIMSRKLTEDFANVQAKEPVLVFEDPSTLEIKVSVPERDLAGRRPEPIGREELTARLKPQVQVTALPDRRFPGRLKELATTADPTTRTYEATFTFENPPDLMVLPGMTAKVTVNMSLEALRGSLAIPAHAAVANEQGQATVWVVDPASTAVRRQPVTLGELMGDKVIVLSGLSTGEVIAVSGLKELREGMVVRPWER